MRIRSGKNIWAGLMFIGIGLFFAIGAGASYPMGTAVRMGPAYFPAVLGGLLALVGLMVLLAALAVDGPRVDRFHFRPLALVLFATIAYGYLMKPLGLVLATVALVFISALAGHEFKWKEVALLAAALVLFSVLVFVKGLTLPFPLWPAALGY